MTVRRCAVFVRGMVAVVALVGGGMATAGPAAAVAAPTVAKVSPTTGKTSAGTRVTVTGTNFSHVQAVRFGAVSGTSLRVVSSTTLVVTAPKHAAGRVDVRVQTAHGTSAVRTADRYTYVSPPTVRVVAPGRGHAGYRITITGTNFRHVTAVRFGTVSGTSIRVLASTRLLVTAPAHRSGRVDVRITSAYGTSAVSARDRYTYDTTPPGPVTHLAATPTSGSSITLTWTNPGDLDFAGVKICRVKGATAPTRTCSAVKTLAKPTARFVDHGLAASTRYTYAVVAKDAVPNYARLATAAATTKTVSDTTAPGPVTAVTVTATTTTSISLSWTNPSTADFTGVMIRRATGSIAPSSPSAGTLVADIAAPAHTVTVTGLASAVASGAGLTGGRSFSFALFAHDAVRNNAVAATKTATTTVVTGAGSWSPSFGLQGAGSDVLAVAVSGSKIYVGGSFTTFGGQPNGTYSHIAEWTGSKWIPLGSGVNGDVLAITVLAGKVYVGGEFTVAGGVSASRLATWDGQHWADVGGVGTTGAVATVRVKAMTTDGVSLYLGGTFDTAGSTDVNSIAVYTPGGGFAALGAGVQTCICGQFIEPGDVHALLWTNGRLWVGGYFDEAGSVVTGDFASWSNGVWAGYGSGLTGGSRVVESLAVDVTSGAIYAGGRFDHANALPASGVAKLLSGVWSAVGDITAGGAIVHVNALSVQGGNLYATGDFTTAGGVTTRNLAVRNGTTWTEVGGGLISAGNALATTSSGGLVVAGAFWGTADSSRQLASIAVWAPGWQTLGQGAQSFNGIAGSVNALVADGSGGVWVAGQFAQLGTVPANNIGHWTNAGWQPLGTGVAIGSSPTAAAVHAMVVLNGQLYVAGQFDHAGSVSASEIARWDGTSWHALGSGLGGRVNALASVGGKLYAAGDIEQAGGGTVGGVAMWDPETLKWSALPGDPSFNDGGIYALASYADRLLFIGGDYADVTVNGAAKLTPGLTWFDTEGTGTTLARYGVIGGADGQIDSLAFSDAGDLYVGGQFARAGVQTGVAGVSASNVAVWHGGDDGSWAGVGGGADGSVFALTVSDGSVYATGTFTHVGGTSHPGVAAFNPSTATWSGLGTGLLGQGSSASYGPAYGDAIVADDTGGAWVGGIFVQTGPTPAGSLNHWIIN